jgi:hypothetical protein
MDEALWEAARSVRPYLPELVGTDAARVDADLAELLTDAQPSETVEKRLRMVLESHDGTRVFLEMLREDVPLYRPPRPEARRNPTKRYSPLAGDHSLIPADKFVCPHGDYTWYRPETGMEVEQCPTHKCPVQPT